MSVVDDAREARSVSKDVESSTNEGESDWDTSVVWTVVPPLAGVSRRDGLGESDSLPDVAWSCCWSPRV